MSLISLNSIFNNTNTTDEPFVPLPVEDETLLIKLAKFKDPAAIEALLLAYAPLLRKEVNKVIRHLPDRDARAEKKQDTIQDALLAFMTVIEDHDLETSGTLGGHLKIALRRTFADSALLDVPMTVPERTLSRFYNFLRAADGDIEQARELAVAGGMRGDTFDSVRAAVRATISLTPSEDEGGDEGKEMLAYPLHSTFYTEYDEVEDQIMIDTMFAAVDDAEARIVQLRYGFVGVEGREPEPMSDSQVGLVINMNPKTVQKRRAKALAKMRVSIGASEVTEIA